MTANINPETGVAYGYISANSLHPEVVDELMDRYNMAADGSLPDHLDDELDDEPEAAGVTPEGVHYCTSYLGGALHFFVLFSPVTTDRARRASPCVPNAGIIDTLDGNVFSYDVPADWRYA